MAMPMSKQVHESHAYEEAYIKENSVYQEAKQKHDSETSQRGDNQ